MREAALLQTFPPTYDFACEYMDAVCEMVGNAVPPRFAAALGATIREALLLHRAALDKAESIAAMTTDGSTPHGRESARVKRKTGDK